MCLTVVQIQPRKPVLLIDHAAYTGPTREHDLDPTDQESTYSTCPKVSTVHLVLLIPGTVTVDIDDLSDMKNTPARWITVITVVSVLLYPERLTHNTRHHPREKYEHSRMIV